MSEEAVQEMVKLLPDIPRFNTALAEWLACMLCIYEMHPRLGGWKFRWISLGALGALALLLVLTPGLEGILWFVCMLGAIALMYLYIRICTSAGWRDVLYYLCRAFVVAEFAASLEWQLTTFLCMYTGIGFETLWLQAVCLVIMYGAIYTLVWLLFRQKEAYRRSLHVEGKQLVPAIVISVAVFVLGNMGYAHLTTPFSSMSQPDIFNARTIADLGGIAMLYAYHIQLWGQRVHRELESVELILQNQYQQYKQSQEVVKLINYKYHDLKHFIIALRSGENQPYGEMLDKMEADLSFYEAQNKTGNEVLDTLLTMKSLMCQKYHIAMTSVVEGTLFSFMDVMDICAIFGNALDNAIEFEKKVTEREKRFIHVVATRQRGFLLMQFENYCDRSLDFQEGLPVTTKKNHRFHGYGLKSLEHTVHKYDGEMDISVENDTFRLKVLLPLPQEKE